MNHNGNLDCMCEWCKILKELQSKPTLSREEIILLIDTYAYTRKTNFTWGQKCFLARMTRKHKTPQNPAQGDN